jgi:hypothetical protein
MRLVRNWLKALVRDKAAILNPYATPTESTGKG